MKILTNRLVSFMLVLVLIFSLSAPALATEYAEYPALETAQYEIGTADEIQAARKAYFSLNPEARQIFDGILADTPELLEFHRTYVDKE